ncbi:MAG: aminotransferase class I/II-fold pyridoxal phosphate-dependent enzyme [Solobacterium sp.]|nr:aminotransferase class I/II-fold pyridoxal phosphate-dependent enzyme [Solobacterium sp.]
MKLPKFEVEQWMTDYENDAVCNLTDTCIPALTVKELLAMDEAGDFQNVRLDYGAITGDLRVKEEILKLYQSGDSDSITTSQGCLQGNEMVMETLLEPGDHVITFKPGYQAFSDYPRALGGTVTELPLYEDDNWQPSVSDLEEAMKQKTKLIILNDPNNPTGIRFNDAFITRMIELAKEQGTWILSDEVYRDPACPSVSDLYDRGISTGSLSKMYSLAGLRFGWIKGPHDLIQKINERRDYSIISTGPLADTLAYIALKNKERLLERAENVIQANREIIQDWLKNEPACSVVLPEFCTVSFLKYEGDIPSKQLALDLLKKHGVFFVPGACFFHENHLRLSLTADPEVMKQGLSLLSSYLHQN